MTEAEYYTLLALKNPIEGAGILGEIGRLSKGRVAVGPGTLFLLLVSLESQKYIMMTPAAGGTEQLYRITAEGLEAFKAEYARLESMAADGGEYAARWPQ